MAFFASTTIAAVLGAPVPLHTPGNSFSLNARIPNHVFRIFNHNRLHDRLHPIVLSATRRYNMTTLFVTFDAARAPLEQCDALHAFHELIPGAFKADLLRYCLVWLHGGWYADMAADFVRDPRPLAEQHDLVVVADPTAPGGYLNGVFGASPRHPGIRAAIDAVKHNVKTCFYGNRDLEPTGPLLLGKVLAPAKYPKVVLPAHLHGEIMHVGDPDLVRNKFEGYREVYAQMGYNKNTASYGHLYDARRVYRHCK